MNVVGRIRYWLRVHRFLPEDAAALGVRKTDAANARQAEIEMIEGLGGRGGGRVSNERRPF